MNHGQPLNVRVTRRFDATPGGLRCLARPKIIGQWMFGPALREEEVVSSRVTVEITPLESGCNVALTHELHPDWADYVDRTEEAWRLMLGALVALLER